jgi:cyclic pyranopterin monophosphate synthase
MGEGRRLTHLDSRGRARMVDVAEKPVTLREAQAEGQVILSPEAFRLVRLNRIAKGDVLGVARIAGIQAAKRTSDWIPLCHPIPLTSVQVELSLKPARRAVVIQSRASARWSTGVEMEALSAVAAAALTIYDMCKSVDRGIRIEGIRLNLKRGGRSGEYRRA